MRRLDRVEDLLHRIRDLHASLTAIVLGERPDSRDRVQEYATAAVASGLPKVRRRTRVTLPREGGRVQQSG
jgi:hypothetical protein